jgi:hypothetical protein
MADKKARDSEMESIPQLIILKMMTGILMNIIFV